MCLDSYWALLGWSSYKITKYETQMYDMQIHFGVCFLGESNQLIFTKLIFKIKFSTIFARTKKRSIQAFEFYETSNIVVEGLKRLCFKTKKKDNTKRKQLVKAENRKSK